MIALDDIKAIARPVDVARRFLGSPNFQKGNTLWYCSPFRNEQHPSFKVDDIGMYDFGTNEHYNIFKFVQKLHHCSFKESVDLLASMYGVSSRDYDSRKLVAWYKKQREEQEKHREFLNSFYLAVWDEVDEELKENTQCLEIFAGDFSDDTYKICLDRQASILGMEEYLAQRIDTWEDKEELLDKAMKGDLPAWLMDRLKVRMTGLLILHTEHTQKREY